MYYFHMEKNQSLPPPFFFFYSTDHPAAEQTAERDQVTHLGWLSIPILESGRTMLSPVYSVSFLGHHSHCHLPAQESPRLLVPSQVLAAGPSWPGPSVLPISSLSPTSGQGSYLCGLLFQRKQTPPCLYQTLTAQPLPGIPRLSFRTFSFLISALSPN